MFNEARLQVDYEVEMAYDLLGLVRKQLREGYEDCWVIKDSRLHKDKIKITTAVGHHRKETLSVSAVSAKSYYCQFKLMLLEEGLLLLKDLMLLIQETSKKIKITVVRVC
nr:hypothetical protein [Tanacetum cinerariifolium]